MNLITKKIRTIRFLLSNSRINETILLKRYDNKTLDTLSEEQLNEIKDNLFHLKTRIRKGKNLVHSRRYAREHKHNYIKSLDND